MYKIQEFVNGHKSRHHLYEKEKTFAQYWKYHANYMDFFNARLPDVRDRNIIAYRNGKQIGRYGVFNGKKIDEQPKLKRTK